MFVWCACVCVTCSLGVSCLWLHPRLGWHLPGWNNSSNPLYQLLYWVMFIFTTQRCRAQHLLWADKRRLSPSSPPAKLNEQTWHSVALFSSRWIGMLCLDSRVPWEITVALREGTVVLLRIQNRPVMGAGGGLLWGVWAYETELQQGAQVCMHRYHRPHHLAGGLLLRTCTAGSMVYGKWK